MARTTDELVIEELDQGEDYDHDRSPSLASAIRWANLVVNRVSTCLTTKGVTVSEEELTVMETLLACHSYVQSDQQYTSKSTGGSSGSFRSGAKAGEGIKGSGYGRKAFDLDFDGCLLAVTTSNNRQMFWGGKAPSEQTPYYQRD